MKTDTVRRFIQRVWNAGNAESAPDCIATAYTVFDDPGDPWEGMTLDHEGFIDNESSAHTGVGNHRDQFPVIGKSHLPKHNARYTDVFLINAPKASGKNAR